MERITVIARNYQWECGDGCCSESKQRYELKYGNDFFYAENIYCEPSQIKEGFISEMQYKSSYEMFEAFKKRLLIEETEIPMPLISLLHEPFTTFGEVLEKIDFDYIYTLDEYD